MKQRSMNVFQIPASTKLPVKIRLQVSIASACLDLLVLCVKKTLMNASVVLVKMEPHAKMESVVIGKEMYVYSFENI